MPGKPEKISTNYLELLTRRIGDPDSLPIVRVNISLIPRLFQDLADAEQEYRLLQIDMERKADTNAPVKMSDTSLADAKARVETLKDEIRNSTVVAVLTPPTGAQVVKVHSSLGENYQMYELWTGVLRESFMRMETPEGAHIPDIGPEQWAELLLVTSATDLARYYKMLEDMSTNAPDFPISRRS